MGDNYSQEVPCSARRTNTTYLPVDGISASSGTIGGDRCGEGLCGAGTIGAGIAGTDYADHEPVAAGTGYSGGDIVLAQDDQGP